MRGDICALIVVLVLGALAVISLVRCQHQHQADRGAATLARLLKPRIPDDCPACRRQLALPPAPRAPAPPVRPWREVKSRRGAPKRITTDGFACPNPACAYSRIADATIHALVGDGKHGRVEQIRTFRCQSCQTCAQGLSKVVFDEVFVRSSS